MKGLVATTAVLGVLAIGGLPALALTLAAEETGRDTQPPSTLGWAKGTDREPPPGWVRNHGGATPHGWAVREWAHCRADQAAGRADAEADCGPKPVSPGHAKKPSGPDSDPEKSKKPKKPKAGRAG